LKKQKNRYLKFLNRMYVADTNALLWFLTDDDRLGNEAKKIFIKSDDGETTIIVPPIVLAESLFIAEKHRVDVQFRTVLDRIDEGLNYDVYPLDLEVILRCQGMRGFELHDRIIMATAKLLNAKLLSKDGKIRKSGIVECVWG